ncbi:trihelix transcription factor DF1-like [Salvia divinorum]|uniref:Trihelix transcription factor DF1-like n=1 Tax=Salvia divinorum TaxID=28513 RepID=A0ABD1IL64_SALDI
MLESSIFVENDGGSAPVAARINVGGEDDGDGERSSGGPRWPREETLALLKIRSEMDTAFRDSALKGPLWDEVSRKLGELGFNRSAKKCKEKFENIYKYHRRTKDGRSSRHSGKNYRFFEQLEFLDNQFSMPSTPLNQIPSYAVDTTAAMEKGGITFSQEFSAIPCSSQDPDAEFRSASTSTTSSSGKDSEGSMKRNRKLADYLERLMKDVLQKQEDLLNKFVEAIEKCEKDRISRDEAWKVHETARIKREQESLAQERAIAAAKDAAVLAFLQKITQQMPSLHVPEILGPLFEKASDKQENELEKLSYLLENGAGETSKQDHSGGENTIQASSSRWPKAEIEALIMLKTDVDLKYQDNGPKGPLWEEISACMKKMGHDRNAKRCKEKWENINKYYKRVKESNKRRPEDSKTCPYFSMLDSLYAKKSKKSQDNLNNLKPEQILMQMMGQQPQQQGSHPLLGEYDDSGHQDQEDDAESGDGYQIVANNLSSVTTLG